MKKTIVLFLALLGLAAGSARAQVPDTITYNRLDEDIVTTMDSVYNGADSNNLPTLTYRSSVDLLLRMLDKTRITTGALINRVYTWNDPNTFDLNGDSTDYERGMQIWNELYLASYNDSDLLDARRLDSIAEYSRIADNKISLAVVNYQFNEIDSAALDDGRLFFDTDTLLNDAGKQTPYITKTTSFPLICDNYLRSDSTNLYFDPSLTLQNISGSTVTALKISSPTGPNLMLTPGESGVLKVANEFLINNETVSIGIDMSFSDGSARHFEQLLNSRKFQRTAEFDGRGQCFYDRGIYSGQSLQFKGYDEPYATQGVGEARFYLRLDRPCSGHLTNPIIITDGFDPKDESQPGPGGVYNLLKYDNNTKSLGLELRQMGYDVVILNFPSYKAQFNIGPIHLSYIRDGGADYMERNAMVLVKLINEINAELAQYNSKEQIVVVGPSMGGQISRYALKYMQNNNMNHNCRLLTEFDSPNLGANIPLGDQAFLWFNGYIMGNTKARKSFDESIRSYAARQLLIYQVGGDIETRINLGYMTLVKHAIQNIEPMRSQWQSMINLMGYPTNLRKIAIVNGQMHGGAEFTSPIVMLDLEGKKKHNPSKGQSMAHYKISSLPPYVHGWSVFDGYIYKQQDYHHYWGSTGSLGSLDFAPGSQYGANATIAASLPVNEDLIKCVVDLGIGSAFNIKVDWEHTNTEKNTFIPTVSAFGFYSSSFNWNNSIWRNLICNPEIPFDDYFAPSTNEDHVFISNASASWMKNQLQYKGVQGAKAPTPVFTTSVIFPNPPTYWVTANFPAPPPSVHYSWSVDFNGQYTSYGTDGGPSASVILSAGDYITYTVTTTGICSETKTRTVHMQSNGKVMRQSGVPGSPSIIRCLPIPPIAPGPSILQIRIRYPSAYASPICRVKCS